MPALRGRADAGTRTAGPYHGVAAATRHGDAPRELEYLHR